MLRYIYIFLYLQMVLNYAVVVFSFRRFELMTRKVLMKLYGGGAYPYIKKRGISGLSIVSDLGMFTTNPANGNANANPRILKRIYKHIIY
jgi:hypothetical protein